jgi:predicted GH43/DUF377 family glycosyl hydrolase
MYHLSPWVWRDDDGYGLLLRAVPKRDDRPALKISRVYVGRSTDGLRFTMGDRPVIAPGPEPYDVDGCEDPTLAVVDGTCYVYYSGWNEAQKTGQLLLAAGPSCEHLAKRGVQLSSPGRANPKEVTIVPLADGTWRLLFEYADEGKSKIGVASAPAVGGPWSVGEPLMTARPDHWDAWHLSTGPVLMADPERPVMLYNGATSDAHWRIGWVAFDAGITRIVARSDNPLITPPAPAREDTDIAFAASAVEQSGEIWLYYSVSDQYLRRATILRGGV